MSNETKLVKVVIFDLDETLWDSDRGRYELFGGVKQVLDTLKRKGYRMAICSHNFTAEKVVKYLGIESYFEIIVGGFYDGFKIHNLGCIMKHFSDVSLDECVFFDDMYENCIHFRQQGIRSKTVSCRTGVTMRDIEDMGLITFFDYVDPFVSTENLPEDGVNYYPYKLE